MHVSHRALQYTATTERIIAGRFVSQALEEVYLAREVAFTANGVVLPDVSVFKYLGCPLSNQDVHWSAVYSNLQKRRQRWARVSQILAREGADTRVSGICYKAVIQSVLLYGCGIWDFTPAVFRVLIRFYNLMARRLSGMLPYPLPREDVPINCGSSGGHHPVSYQPLHQRPPGYNGGQCRHSPYLSPLTESRRSSGSTKRTLWWTQAGLEE